MESTLTQEFQKEFGKKPEQLFFCPGRVNLIGEHIDYNGGKVMPCAITFGTYLAVSRNTEKIFRFRCLNFPEKADIHLQGSYARSGKDWYNYPLGVINEFLKEDHALSGLDLLYFGNLPIGAGLSSSASIEVLTAYALKTIFAIDISRQEIALLGKRVENDFIGVNSGIMDQFAVAMGKASKAILLNCDTLEFEYLPFEIGEYVLAIINSNKQRALADSKYNERFAQCGAALKLLKKGLQAENLCEISPAVFEENRHLINDTILEKRALHVVTENERVNQAKEALSLGDLARFGELMYASHYSLQELYEVSGAELDTIVEFSKGYDGCIGARMTGAGFGGCAIALVKGASFDDYAKKLTAYYNERIGYAPGVFKSAIGDGVKEI